MPRFLRVLALLLVGSCLALPTANADDAWLTVRLTRPGRLLEHDLVTTVEAALQESPDYRDRLQTPEMQRLDGARELLESTLGIDWRAGLDRLARYVELRSFDPRRPQEAVLVVQADSRKTLAKLLAAIADRTPPVQVLANDAAQSPKPLPPIRRLGQAFVTVDGPRLIVSPVEARLRAAIGRSLETKEGDGPVLHASVDVAAVRDLPQFQKGVALPARDPAAVAFLGGWIDHLGRGRSLDVTLDASGPSLQLTARLTSDPNGSNDDQPRVVGSFAPTGETIPAPLAPTGTIYSASWYNDFAQLWDDRAKLVEPEVVARMEKRDAESGVELKVLGLHRPPSEIVRLLGTEYHVVVTRGEQLAYDVDLDERLPQAAFAVSLRDEAAFRDALQPVFKTFGLILAGQQKLLVTSKRHGDASITMARYRDDDASQGSGNLLRYHFSPSWTIAGGHFVIGTTTAAVEGVLDALAEPAPATANTTSSSVLSLDTLAGAIDDAATLLISRAQLDQGVSSERAKDELATLRTILRTLGTARTRTAATDDTVEVTIEIGPNP